MNEQLPDMTYDEVRDALPAYALGALAPAEMEAIDHYFQQQVALFQELDEAEETLSLLPHLAQPAPVPGQIKRDLFQRIHKEQANAYAQESFSQIMEGDAPADQVENPLLMRTAPQAVLDPQSGQRYIIPHPNARSQGIPVHSFPPPRSRSWAETLGTFAWNAMAIAAVLAVILIGTYQYLLQQQVSTAETMIAAFTQNLEQASQTVANLESSNLTLQRENQQLSEELQAVDNRVTLVGAANRALIMLGTEEAPGLQGTFFLREQQRTGALVVHGLHPLPPDSIYQLWLVTPQGEQFPVSIVPVQANIEPTWVNIELPIDVSSFTAAGISIEPAGGSSQPTGPMLLETPIG